MTKYTSADEFEMLLHAKESLEAAKEKELRDSLELQQKLLDKISELQQKLEEEKKRCSQEINLLDQSLKVHVAQLKRDYNYPPEQPKKVVYLEDNESHDDSDK